MLIPLHRVVNKKSHLRSNKLEFKYMKPDIKLRWPQTHINKMFLNVSLPPNFGKLYGQINSIIFRCGENYAVNVNKMLFFALIFFVWANSQHFTGPLPPSSEQIWSISVDPSLPITMLIWLMNVPFINLPLS